MCAFRIFKLLATIFGGPTIMIRAEDGIGACQHIRQERHRVTCLQQRKIDICRLRKSGQGRTRGVAVDHRGAGCVAVWPRMEATAAWKLRRSKCSLPATHGRINPVYVMVLEWIFNHVGKKGGFFSNREGKKNSHPLANKKSAGNLFGTQPQPRWSGLRLGLCLLFLIWVR